MILLIYRIMMYSLLATFCMHSVLHLVFARTAPQFREWPPLSVYKRDIASSKSVTDTIIDYILTGAAKGQVYNRLANMTDKFGPR